MGYLHSIQFAKPSLVCDIQEIFRALIEDFLIKYHQNLDPESFIQKGRRMFLKPKEKLKIILAVTKLFNRKIKYTRIKNFGEKAKIRTVIKEELIKLAQYLRRNMTYEPVIGVFLAT